MDKFSQIRRILIAVLFFNWLVAFGKIIYGLITKCASMTADGVHSFGDGASNIVGLIGIWAASKPKDADHPYGHRKFETVATLGIAFILFLASFNILRGAFLRIFHPVVPDVTNFSFILMIVTMGINIGVMKYERRRGEQLSSDILVCDSLHTRSDVFASIGVVGTLISIKMGFPFLDIVVAGFIAILIARSGIEIIKTSSNILCDGTVVPRSEIVNTLKTHPEVKSVHKIRTRGRKDDIHIDLHIVTNPKMYVADAHLLSHEIEAILKNRISGVTDVSVHIEPSR